MIGPDGVVGAAVKRKKSMFPVGKGDGNLGNYYQLLFFGDEKTWGFKEVRSSPKHDPFANGTCKSCTCV